MASNHTSNYNLNQWEASDKVLRTEFNEDNDKIDAALTSLAGQVASKADKSALDAEVSARTAAISAVNAALALRGNCRVETFRYTGSGTGENRITFSGQPAFFILVGPESIVCGGGPGGFVGSVFNVDGRSANGEVKTVWSGNTVTLIGSINSAANQNGYSYQGVAFYVQTAE